MRAASILALGCYAAVSSAKDILDDIEESAQEATSSVASAVESVTSSAIEKPTFTVSLHHNELSNPSQC
jgi:calnexin